MPLHLPASPIHWALAAASAAAVVFFAAGLTLYFERSARPAWVIAIHYTSMALVVSQFLGVLLLRPRGDGWVAAGIAMYTAALLIFLSAIESAKRTRLQRSFVDHPLPERLITDGHFAWVRHPFCAGYLLGAMAAPIAIEHPVLLATSAALMAVTVAAAVREERVWLSSARADEYRAYRQRTGMFVPSIGRR